MSNSQTSEAADVQAAAATQSTPSIYERRFGGMQRLYGLSGAEAIAQAHVAVVGIGGVGSWTAEALARSGVGAITLIDLDHVAESNINRQLHALETTLGQAKVQAMQERIALINPLCRVTLVDDFLDEANAQQLIGGAGIDAVVDACDQVRAKAAIAKTMVTLGRPFVVVGAAGGRTQPQLVEVEDLGHLSHDPLLAQLRYRLRRYEGFPKDGKRMHVPCVFSREAVRQADASCAVQADSSLNCAGYGSVVTVTATFGMVAAGLILNKLANFSHKP